MNDRQKILVDVRTSQGQKLYEGIRTGETVYPDEYHENLARAHRWLLHHPTLGDKKQGFEYAIEAFNEHQTPVVMMEIIVNAARFVDLLPVVQKFCEDYTKSFEENKGKWINEDGYRMKVEAARLANYNLAQLANKQGDQALANLYMDQREFCFSELKRIGLEKRW